MVSINNILYLFAILVSLTTVLAQDGSSEAPTTHEPFPPLPSAAPGPFDHFAFKLPKFEWPQIPGVEMFGGGSRQKRSPDQRPDIEHAAQDQAFFQRVIKCNFKTEGGFKCTSCHTLRRCYRINYGTVTTCGGLFPYCNNGQCSFRKGDLCKSTTTSTTETTTTDSSNGTTTTG